MNCNNIKTENECYKKYPFCGWNNDKGQSSKEICSSISDDCSKKNKELESNYARILGKAYSGGQSMCSYVPGVGVADMCKTNSKICRTIEPTDNREYWKDGTISSFGRNCMNKNPFCVFNNAEGNNVDSKNFECINASVYCPTLTAFQCEGTSKEYKKWLESLVKDSIVDDVKAICAWDEKSSTCNSIE